MKAIPVRVPRIVIRVFCLILVLAFSGVSLFAGSKPSISLQLGVKGFYLSPVQNGDFAGTTYFESDTELFLVPKLSTGSALGPMLGGQIELNIPFLQAIGLEVGFRSSKHTYSFMDASSDSTKAEAGGLFFGIQVYFLKKTLFQPFLTLEMDIFSLNVKNGSYSYTEPLRVGDATYKGSDYGVGIGAALHLPLRLTLSATAGYHIFILHDVKGVLGTEYQTQATKGTYPRFAAALCYSFKLGKS